MRGFMSQIKVRLAPSPTGPLHIGTARTALFNFLFARQNKGEFILRFENTDESRSTKEFEKNITENLKWLGIDWDGKPYYQMQRLKKYKKAADELVKNGFAEKAGGAVLFKAKNALDNLKIKSQKMVRIFEKDKGEKDQKSYLVKNIAEDLIHGQISGLVSDTILLRKDGIPTYHLAVVVDDAEMGITHVIRGDDHFSNTPLHVVLQKALSFKTPQYAHLPLILNPDKSKMSKRISTVDISEYRRNGYLPEAMVNFLALFGWAPKSNSQILSLKELIAEFDLTKVQKSAAIFDLQKLDFINGFYIRKMPLEKLDKMLRSGFYPKTNKDTLDLTKALQTRIVKLSDAQKMSEFFFNYKMPSKELLIFKKSDWVKTKKGLEQTIKILQETPTIAWTSINSLNNTLNDVVEDNNLTNGDVFWPVRVVLSGVEQSPSPAELLNILGKTESLDRIRKAVEIL